MRRLLITATLLALASAAPAVAQSYRDAISPGDRQAAPYEDRQAPSEEGDRAYDGRGAAPGGAYRYQDTAGPQVAYADQGAYPQPQAYRPPPRRHHRRARAAAVSRYTASGRPVHYNDGMIRTGRDYPAGTVGLNGY